MNATITLPPPVAPKNRFRRYLAASEVKILTLRESGATTAETMDEPRKIAAFFHASVATASWFDPMKECLVVFMLNTRRNLMCWNLVTLGILDSCLFHPREIYRAAVVAGASGIVIAHNHPSGDPTPSDPDIRMTRDLAQAGRTLKIDLLDHVVIGEPAIDPCRTGYRSLRELGYIHSI